ncbi:zinc metalloproteinase nas-36-like [Saccostrea cucullata]|uniref:zinc metalloproteinase nas-36-like n=1 Tax=Saccostrea cuccullata TaxID=36930 RepID=UPI002ED5C6F0
MHALGQLHEHSRSDRETFISIIKGNIKKEFMDNFEKYDTFDRTPYDVESVMQYSLNAGAKDESKPTMMLHDQSLAFLIGLSKTMTFYDVQEINKAYQCSALCKEDPPVCQNGGYVLHTCQCMCPDDLNGTTCNQVKSDKDCGGIIDLDWNQYESIPSDKYPWKYRTNKRCVWMIRGPSDSNIKLTIKKLNLSVSKGQACYHWLEIKYNLVGQSGIRRCNNPSAEEITEITTTDSVDKNIMILTFDSKISKDIKLPKDDPGMLLEVKVV